MKEKSTNAINYVNENPGKSLVFGATLGIGYLAYKRFTRKKEESTSNSNKKPRYKRWYTWVAGGIAGIALWKNWGSVADWFKGLFGKEKDPTV